MSGSAIISYIVSMSLSTKCYPSYAAPYSGRDHHVILYPYCLPPNRSYFCRCFCSRLDTASRLISNVDFDMVYDHVQRNVPAIQQVSNILSLPLRFHHWPFTLFGCYPHFCSHCCVWCMRNVEHVVVIFGVDVVLILDLLSSYWQRIWKVVVKNGRNIRDMVSTVLLCLKGVCHFYSLLHVMVRKPISNKLRMAFTSPLVLSRLLIYPRRYLQAFKSYKQADIHQKNRQTTS